MILKKIGIIHSPYKLNGEAPRQGRLAPDVESLIQIDSLYEAGLKDIETFSHIYVFYDFNRSNGWNLLIQTPWENERHGIFATRSSRRPNPIAITVVKLVKRTGCTLFVQGLDAFDETPVFDLKPYVPRFDRIEEAQGGWFNDRNLKPK
jgi:tRNA-Thr(GGU) m(6)t(6)A37 methyltransferase TsaA